MECHNILTSTESQTTPQVIYQPSGDQRGLPKLKLTEFLGDPLEWPQWSELFDVMGHQKRLSDTEKLQYLKTSLTGQAKATVSGLDFSSQAYYQTCDILFKKFGRPRFTIESKLIKINFHPPSVRSSGYGTYRIIDY